MKRRYRVDHIGSLQRPKALLDEVHSIYETGHTALMAEERQKDRSRLHAIEDAAIAQVLRRQEEIGLPVVTDGEFRRIMYFNSFFDAVEGIAPSVAKLQFRGDDGTVVEHEGPAAIVGRLRKIDNPAAREARFTAARTNRTVKVTFPTASFLVAQAILGPAVTGGAYRSHEEVAGALVAILRELVDETIAAGASYVQFDVSGYMMIAASPIGQMLRSKGIDVDALLARMMEADREVVAGLPTHITTCLHQCRGNYASRYIVRHDHLGELGEAFFSLPYDRFTLEWDGRVERGEADYEALSRVPRGGATVVLGVVSTRHREMESADEIRRTVDRAARHIPIDQLAISPQCGFASALTTGDDNRPDGNLIDEDVQWRKLALLVDTARDIWGEA